MPPSFSIPSNQILPPEIVDHIIDLLFGDIKSLRSCSLVSNGWVHRSRYNLFANVKFLNLPHFYSWFEAGMGKYSHHVRSLDLTQRPDESKWMIPAKLETSQHHFTPFCNVKYLSLTDLNLTPFDEHSLTKYFGHFSGHLTSLRLHNFTAHPDALLFFVCMFPGLDNLKIDRFWGGRATVPSRIPATTPRFLGGKLTLKNIVFITNPIAPFLAVLPNAFEYVCVESCTLRVLRPLNDLFAACQETIKKVKVSKVYFDPVPQGMALDLSPCKGIEEVKLFLEELWEPDPLIKQILETVTSSRVRKITFNVENIWTTADINTEIIPLSWIALDAIFLKMANTLCPTEGRLEIVFRIQAAQFLGDFNPGYPDWFLEGCRTKAVVRFERI